jgi:hypothetical protein
VEASLNSIEFSLREFNTGSFPKGLSVMLSALNQVSRWHLAAVLALLSFLGFLIFPLAALSVVFLHAP